MRSVAASPRGEREREREREREGSLEPCLSCGVDVVDDAILLQRRHGAVVGFIAGVVSDCTSSVSSLKKYQTGMGWAALLTCPARVYLLEASLIRRLLGEMLEHAFRHGGAADVAHATEEDTYLLRHFDRVQEKGGGGGGLSSTGQSKKKKTKKMYELGHEGCSPGYKR